MSKIRQQRTAEQIRLIMSDLMQRGLRDPRLQGITVTQVTIDRELQHADVFVNALGDEGREKEVMSAMRKATGYMRRELAQRLSGRTVPQLRFRWDPTLAHAETVYSILDNLDIPPADEPTDPEDEPTDPEIESPAQNE